MVFGKVGPDTDNTATPWMTINSEGNVGIGTGTATPTGRLQIVDNYLNIFTSAGASNGWAKDGLTVLSNPDAGFSSMVINSEHAVVYDRGLFNVKRQNNSQFYIRMDGAVGIGTTSPASKLDVVGGIKATGAAGFSFNTNDTDGGLFSPADGVVTINTNGAERVRVGTGSSASPTLAVGGIVHAFTSTGSASFQTYAGALGTNSGNELILGNFGFGSPNNTSLAVGAYRHTSGNIWENSSITLSMKVDSSSVAKFVALGNNGVGINTYNPTYPLEVQGGTGANKSYSGAGQFFAVGYNGTGSNWNVGIYSENAIVGSVIVARSDERLKHVIGRTNGASDLAKLAQIEVTDYQYKDVVEHGDGMQKKLIAQQVEKVFPQAVGSSVGVVPDIYQEARFEQGWVVLPTNLQVGERVRLITDKSSAVHEVLEVAAGRFRTDLVSTDATVFVYGREVKDLRFVDYDAIAMLNVSATQELAKRLQDKESRITSLEARLAALEKLLSPAK